MACLYLENEYLENNTREYQHYRPGPDHQEVDEGGEGDGEHEAAQGEQEAGVARVLGGGEGADLGRGQGAGTRAGEVLSPGGPDLTGLDVEVS